MTEARVVEARFGPAPFSLEGLAQLVRQLGGVDGTDLGPLARKLQVPADSFHVKAAADLLGLSEEPRELPELYATIRRLLESEAPLRVVFHNVETAGPAFFNLLAYLGEVLDDRVTIECKDSGGPAPQMPSDPDELLSAGFRSLRRSDMPAAYAYLARAAAVLPPGPDRFACMAACCDALLAADKPEAALSMAEDGFRQASQLGDRSFGARFRFFVLLLGDAQAEDLEGDLTGIATTLEAAGDGPGAAQAVEALAHVRADRGDLPGANETMQRALALSRTGHDKQTTSRIVAWLCDGLDSVEEVDELAWVAGYSPLLEVKRLTTRARLEKNEGDLEAARADLHAAVALREDLGQPAHIAGIPESLQVGDL